MQRSSHNSSTVLEPSSGAPTSGEAGGLEVEDQGGATVELDLVVDGVKMNLYRTFGDTHPVGDLLVPETKDQRADHLDFAGGQHLDDSTTLVVGLLRPVGNRARQVGLDPLLAGVDVPDALHDQLGRHLLEQDTPDPQTDALSPLPSLPP